MKELLSLLSEFFEYGFERFGLYYGSYRAFVYSVDDPDNLNRIQIILPFIDANTPLKTWVFPVGNYAGNNYGVQNLPKKGDIVYVEFDHGSLKRPFWKHGYFSKGEKPQKESLQNKDNHWFKTPNGLLVEFDDSQNKISISNEKGYSIIISESELLSGKLDETYEPSVLGNKQEQLINDLISLNSDIINSLFQYASAESTAASGLGLTPIATAASGLATALNLNKATLESIKPKVSSIKAKNTKIN